MRISLSTLNQIFQTISVVFQEVAAFEAELTKPHNLPTSPSEVAEASTDTEKVST